MEKIAQQMQIMTLQTFFTKSSKVTLHNLKKSCGHPPTVGKREILPGEDYRCRCVAILVFEDEED